MDVDAIERWIEADPDEQTAREVRELLEASQGADASEADVARADLADRFAGPLEFGTAGLRGALGGGPNRMNRAVVIRTTAGLATFLAAKIPEGRPRVVIGYDARHGSSRFARDAAAVITGAGGQAMLLPEPGPTPVLAFAVRRLDADAGIMVTASHNPPQDNGYKVYLGGRVVTDEGQGAQIVAPYDAEITEHIAAIGALEEVARPASGWQVLGDEVTEAYLERTAALVTRGAARPLRIVYTPMHGVGGEVAVEALRRAGFTDVHVVAEQAAPDPDFPTIAFPNPEEPGAMDLSLRLAYRVGADLVIANDPDADRCSLAVPDANTTRGWRQLTGDEVGALLGQQAATAAALGGGGVLASSVVSSRLLPRVAAAHGLRHTTTLTGFKWISRAPDLVYGYEEALGYCVDPAAVRDKDGISAALRLALLASQLADRGATVLDALDDLAVKHGLHATAPLSLRVADLAEIREAMARLRESGPAALAGSPVTETVDLAAGWGTLPATDGLVFTTADDDRVIIRPSGTEPKLKCYIEVIVAVAGRDDVLDARRLAAVRLARIQDELTALIGL